MILLNIAGLARPARRAANSSRVVSTDLSILPSASWRMSLITGPFPSWSRLRLAPEQPLGRSGASVGGDERANRLTLDYAQHVPLRVEAEDDEVHLVLLRQGEGSLVDDAQVARDRLLEGDPV